MEEVARLVRLRRACPEVGWGRTKIVETGQESVLGLCSEWRKGCVLTLHNLSGRARKVRLDLGPLTPLVGEDRAAVEAGDRITLPPFGYRWFRVGGERR